jgi:2-dehydropantoate 2-reductase
LGAGSLGCLVGGLLAESGSEVTLIARRRHVEAIKEKGLILKSPRGTRSIEIRATDDPTKVRGADALILTTKTKDTAESLDSVSHLSSSLQLCFSLQNGLRKDDFLIEKFGSERVLGAVTTEGATLIGDGEVEHTAEGITLFGAIGGEEDARGIENSEKMAKLFNNAGLKAETVNDIKAAEWGKLLRMASGAVIAILTRLEYHKIIKNFDLAWCYIRLMREFAEIARANSIELQDFPQMTVKSLIDSPLEDAVKMTVLSGKRTEDAGVTRVKISALQDIERGRKTEVEELLGYPLSLAAKLNVKTPQLEFMYRLIKGIDSYLL